MVALIQSFEFSASHRLYSGSLSEAENFALFGKCAHANGHGHNYVVEVTVSGVPDPRTGSVTDLPRLNELVRRQVIEQFDHKHLNVDCEEFADLNPTVENLARVIWGKLAGALKQGRLSRVRVWETPKTWAECDGADEPG